MTPTLEDLQYRLQASASELIAFLVRAHRAEVIEALGVDYETAARAAWDVTDEFVRHPTPPTDLSSADWAMWIETVVRPIVDAALGIEEGDDE